MRLNVAVPRSVLMQGMEQLAAAVSDARCARSLEFSV